MVSILTGRGILLVVLCAAFLSGCCPGGVAVLESLTLPVEEQNDCSLVPPSQVTDGPVVAASTNPVATSNSETVATIAPAIIGSAIERVKSAYAAVYECEPGGPKVRVYAIVFYEPTDPVRAAALDANPNGVMFKGQLAGVVLADDGACESCYDAVRARAERVLGK
ncbi:MAG: hypothetical protein KAW67_02835 [Candidatus Eisenbacteria sp.]|nr:hypothetical protein [Candidatus Eisenbacteria bacterium]